MRSRHRWIPALALGLCAGVLCAAPVSAATAALLPQASAAPTPPATKAQAPSQPPAPSSSATTGAAEPTTSPSPSHAPNLGEEEKYWTADRMDNAVPVDSITAPAAAARHGLTGAAAAHRPPPSGTPDPEHFGGHPMVGTFFFDGTPLGGKSTYCTGSVVHTAAKDIVLTAGHCGVGLNGAKHRIFVPQYRNGESAADQPHGVFPVTQVYLDPRYKKNTKAPTSDLDLAFVWAGANSRGEVEDVTGALTFTPTTSFTHKVTVIGYPSTDSVNPKHEPVRCPVTTAQLPGFRQMRMTCKGFYGGVSGGPWIEDYDPTTGTGKVIGNTGGYNGGGNDANDDWVTYSPIYGEDAQDLFNDAAAHRLVDSKPPYQPSTDPWLPGTAPTWQHAKLLASGDFRHTGHSDMILVWTDGEVTLYPGNGRGGYDTERQLLAANSTWTHAATITAGDFTGSNQFDLLVRWSDGEVTLYGDVGSKGLNRAGTQMIKPNDTWKNATQIAAGRFNASQYVTDLIVRWVDGELTLYTNVSAGTFGQEHKLKSPHDTWKDATLLTSGEFSGNQTWDLMVRWSDGELDNYVGTTTSGLGTEQRILNPNKLWTHDAAMTTGDYTGNGRTDDLLIRWSDGETTMYTDTLANRLGTEHTLVAPTS
ncbi:trypsin-like serine protease [Streptomyces sp. NPDC047082]|uniref:trypsin-like serine peptidase n=1 Tax=Streptomyces sp. NPDC047082 TaxID=3155259 RepID=UPI0033D9A659